MLGHGDFETRCQSLSLLREPRCERLDGSFARAAPARDAPRLNRESFRLEREAPLLEREAPMLERDPPTLGREASTLGRE